MKLLKSFIALVSLVFTVGTVQAQIAIESSLTKQDLHGATDTANAFLNAWLVEQNIEKAANFIEMTEGNELRVGQLVRYYELSGVKDVTSWTRKVLVLLLSDRADVFIEARRKAKMTHNGYVSLPENTSGLSGLIHPKSSGEKIVMGTSIIFGDTVILSMQFAHAAQGDFSMMLEKVNGAWKIVNFNFRAPREEPCLAF